LLVFQTQIGEIFVSNDAYLDENTSLPATSEETIARKMSMFLFYRVFNYKGFKKLNFIFGEISNKIFKDYKGFNISAM
jgi:hypothetical protein